MRIKDDKLKCSNKETVIHMYRHLTTLCTKHKISRRKFEISGMKLFNDAMFENKIHRRVSSCVSDRFSEIRVSKSINVFASFFPPSPYIKNEVFVIRNTNMSLTKIHSGTKNVSAEKDRKNKPNTVSCRC